ncbi:peptidylprolyl isomerase [Salinisphaera sp. T31B1]|uniref:peptidylprolyl isomerase n=1 Tax=Salinisphaera sp. T31B1 TaxID=727963 RepID=UPI00334176F2
MTHTILRRLALTALPLTLAAAPAFAQGSLSDFSLLSSPGQSAPAAPQGPQTIDRIVAVVGDDVVLESELDSAVAQVRARSGGRADQLPPNVLRSQILDQLIMTKLQVARAKEQNIQVSDQEIDQGIARIAQQNNMSMAQFNQAVAADPSMTVPQLREQVQQELMVSKLRRQEVMSKVVVTDDDVDRYLENQSLRGDGQSPLDSGQRVMVDEIKARHILLKPNEIRDDQRTRELARQIKERLAAGDDFAALAREYSDDNATANQGGELGWVQPARLDPNSRRQLASLNNGQVSQIFQTQEGYELIKVEDRRQRDQTREAMRNQARMALGEQKSGEEGELWLRKLRDEAYVDIRMPNYQPTTGG